MAALFGQPLAYLCCDVANYTRKRRNVINFKKNLSENLSS